jgi:hypothetical protein
LGELYFSFCNCFVFLVANPKEGFIRKSLDFPLMSVSTIVAIVSQGNPSLKGERRSNKWKCIKKLEVFVSLSLGEKIDLNNVLELEKHVVVIWFTSRKMNRESLKEWNKVNFEPFVGYLPHIMTLVKEWFAWVFKSTMYVNQFLHSI